MFKPERLMKLHTRATAALMMTCGLGLFAAAAPAAAANEALNIGNGTLLAKGIGFKLSYTYTCRPGYFARSVVDVSQRMSQTRMAVAVGGSNSSTKCTGNPQTINVVGFIKDNLPLKSGVALATLTVHLDSPQAFETLQLAKEIRLSKK